MRSILLHISENIQFHLFRAYPIYRPHGKLLCVLFLSACMFPHSVTAQVETENVINMGRSALGHDDNVTAIYYFNQAIEAKPFLYKPYYFRGYAKFSLGDYQGAEADCTKAIDLNPYIVELYQLRGICRIRNNDFKGAVADYTRTLAEFPDEQNALYNRALCYVELKDYPAAAADMKHVLDKYPDFYRAYIVKAQIALEQKDTLAGIACLDTLLSRNPKEASAWAFKGRYAYQQNDFHLADSCLTQAVRWRPRDYESYLVRAAARHAMNRFGKAIEDYDKTIELVPQHFVAHYNRGLLRALIGDNNRAIEDFDFIIAKEPDNVMAIYNRAQLRQQTGNYKGAIADYSRLIKEYPNFLAGYLARAECRRKIGDIRGALNDESVISRANLDITFGKARKPVKKVRRRSDHSLDKYEQLVEEDADSLESPFSKILSEEWIGKVQNRKEERDLLPMFAFSFKQHKQQGYSSSGFMNEAARISRLFRSRQLSLTTGSPTADRSELEQLRSQLSDTTLHLSTAERLFLSSVIHRDLYDDDSALSDISDALSGHPGTEVSTVLNLQYAVLLTDKLRQKKANPSSAPSASGNDRNAATLRAASMEAIRTAMQISPDNPFLYYNRGCLNALDNHSPQAAIEDFTRAIELDPRFPEAYFNRGVTYLLQDEREKAVADFSRAGELGLYKAYNPLKQSREK